MSGRLPNLVVVGAMKCGTTALHRYLAAHPQISMAQVKEANFFIGPDTAPHTDEGEWWRTGNWHRGVGWYASLFDADAPVRGETSPGYTSPDSVVAAERMAAVIPEARLVYLVREPLERAVSQYDHHVRDGTERRPVAEALLDPASQYVDRSRFHERLQPYLELFDKERLHVVVSERLRTHRRAELRKVFAHAGADPDFWSADLNTSHHVGGAASAVDDSLRTRFRSLVADDVDRLRTLTDDAIPEWST